MERKVNIDLLRIISAVAVVIIHVISGPTTNYSGILNSDIITTLNCVHSLMNWSVPVFFMITGYCILRKETYSYSDCFRHISKYIIVLFTIGFAYAALEEISKVRAINLSVVIISLQNVISGNLWDHMWYIYAMLGVYLVLPVIHSFMQVDKRNRFILTGLLFCFTIFLPAIEQWLTVGIDLPFGGYLFYICFGGMIAKNDFGKRKYCAMLISLISAVYILCNPTIDCGYRSLSICIMAVSIFTFVNALSIKSSKIIIIVSQCTWGVYLIHPLFINIIVKLLKVDLLSHIPYLKLTVFLLCICIVSFIVTYVLRKIPVINKLF